MNFDIPKNYLYLGIGLIASLGILFSVYFTGNGLLQGNVSFTAGDSITGTDENSDLKAKNKRQFNSLKKQVTDSYESVTAQLSDTKAVLGDQSAKIRSVAESAIDNIENKLASIGQYLKETNLAYDSLTEAEILNAVDRLNDFESQLESIESNLETLLLKLGEAASVEASMCPLDDASSNTDRNFKNRYDQYKSTIQTLNAKSVYSDADMESLLDIMSKMFADAGSFKAGADECFQPNLINRTVAINDFKSEYESAAINKSIQVANTIITSYNQGPIKCYRAKSCTDLSNLTQLSPSKFCETGTAYDASLNTCVATSCKYDQVLASFDLLYKDLQEYEEGDNINSRLIAARQALNRSDLNTNLISSFIDEFDDSKVNLLVDALNVYVERMDDPVCEAEEYDEIDLEQTVVTGGDVRTNDDTFYYCADGEIVESLEDCDESDEETVIGNPDEDTDDTDDDLVIDDDLDFDDFEDNDGGLALPSASGQNFELNSNTNGGAIITPMIQGDTGPEIYVFALILLFFGFNIAIWSKK